jgi:hypothetical protein
MEQGSNRKNRVKQEKQDKLIRPIFWPRILENREKQVFLN